MQILRRGERIMSDPADQSEPQRSPIEVFDLLEIRCPRLGGQVTFGYCRREGGHRPCPRSLICWGRLIPVEAYFKGLLSADAYDQCFAATPKPRIASLLECIEEAKKRTVQNVGGSETSD